MNQFPASTPAPNPEPPRFDFFFDRLETCQRKGRGFSLFQADAACLTEFSEQCRRRGLAPLTIHLSSYQFESDLPAGPASPTFVVLVQDLSYADFLDRASEIADRLVFPLWFRRVPVCFFSALGRDAYEAPSINSDDLHRDFTRAVRALLAEQVMTLLERSNYQFAAPELARHPCPAAGLHTDRRKAAWGAGAAQPVL